MSAVRIKGAVDAAEVAAVLALLLRDDGPPAPSGYDRWREQRLQALRKARATRAR